MVPGQSDDVADPACAAAHGEVRPPPDRRRLVLVFVSPVAAEMAVLADRLSWPVTVIDPDRARLDAEPVPYARTCLSVAEARLTAGCDVVVCDHDRPELGAVLTAVLAGPFRWVGVLGSLRHTAPHVAALQQRGVPAHLIALVRRPIGLDVGSRTPPEIAVSTVAGLLADRNGRSGGPFPACPEEAFMRPPVPPFTAQTAAQKVQAAEDAWNTRDPARVAAAYTPDTVWRNRSQFLTGRAEVEQFLQDKWEREHDYALRKSLWAFTDNRIAVRFQYEWHDDDGRWWRSHGNENWEFDAEGYMRRREASINDVAISEQDRRIFGPRAEQDRGAELPLQ